MKFIIVSGVSGAGKSQALKALEDAGYFCVDNLPLSVSEKFLEICHKSETFKKVALGIDIRGQLFFSEFNHFIQALKVFGIKYTMVFLEATDDTLVSRFKETRRKHPLWEEGTVLDDIKRERELLEPIKNVADLIIDTTDTELKELRKKILLFAEEKESLKDMVIDVSSFGYKYGCPKDGDIVFDVRFLPNPFYVKELKHKTGLDKKVEDYVMMWPNTKRFLKKFMDLVEFILPQYIKEGKKQLHIAIGCTGGKHRSVVLSETIAEILKKDGYKVYIKHRDIEV